MALDDRDARDDPHGGDPTDPADAADTDERQDVEEPREARPLIERLGLAAVALVLATLFGGVAVASWIGGEIFLAVMGGIGCLMTAWVGVLTLIRG
jgi:fatty acid desaturase